MSSEAKILVTCMFNCVIFKDKEIIDLMAYILIALLLLDIGEVIYEDRTGSL